MNLRNTNDKVKNNYSVLLIHNSNVFETVIV